jgi:hypothetical protein
MLLAAACAVAALIGTGGCKGVPERRGPLLAPPLRFLLVGDSMMAGNFGCMLEERIRGTRGLQALRVAVMSTGLSEYHPYDWAGRSVRYIAQYRPDVLVASFGANDCLALRRKNGSLLYYGAPGWEAEYSARIHGYLRTVTPLVRRVYLVGQPATDHPILAPKYPVANRLYREACERYDNAAYVPAWELTSDNGKFLPVMKDRNGISGMVKFPGDPIHHSPFGGRVLADLFLDFIRNDCGLEPPARR